MLVRGAALLASVLVAACAAGSARAGTIVALAPGAHVPRDARPVAPSLRLWLVPSREAAHLRDVLVSGPNRRVRPLTAPPQQAPPTAGGWWLSAVGADQAQPPGPGKPVAIVDTGVDVTLPEFSAESLLLLNAQHTTPGPEEYHGTAVASIVGAPVDGKGMQGIYPGATLMSYDAGGETLADVLAGIAVALEQPGPGVINLSVAFEGTAGSTVLGYGVDSAIAAGWLVVAAAGNGGGRGNPPTYPADLPHVLTVGATDRNGGVALSSTRSPWVDLAAPGVGIVAAVPAWKDPSGLATLSGTSYAAPIVSGAAAWLWSSRPLLDETQVFEILRRSATDLGAPGDDNASGYGLLNVPRALAAATPIRDPQEPNDDIDLVAQGGLFTVGTEPLVDRQRPHTHVAARLDRYDDPADVYRVFVPAGRELVASVEHGPVQLGVWAPQATSIHERRKLRQRDLLDAGRTVETASLGRKGAYYYLAVTPKPGVRTATYLLSVALRVSR